MSLPCRCLKAARPGAPCSPSRRLGTAGDWSSALFKARPTLNHAVAARTGARRQHGAGGTEQQHPERRAPPLGSLPARAPRDRATKRASGNPPVPTKAPGFTFPGCHRSRRAPSAVLRRTAANPQGTTRGGHSVRDASERAVVDPFRRASRPELPAARAGSGTGARP